LIAKQEKTQMKRIISTLFGLAILCLFAEAQAVPATVSFTGRLSTSTGPVSGAVTVTFSLFNQATNGTVMWTETRSLTATAAGLVYADLGSMTTLDEGILTDAPLFLEIQVGSEVLTPRLPLQSVPYAIRAETANTLGGTVTADEVVTAATAPISIATGTASLTTCGANQIYKMVGGSWQCAADTDTNTTYSAVAGGGLALSGTAFGLLTTCANGQVLKAGASAGQWACANDTDTSTTYTSAAGGGINVSGTAIGLLTTCANGQVLKAGATAGQWACGTDTNTTYTAVAGGGINVSGTTLGLLTTCSNGQVLKAGATAGQWACANDTDTTTTYTGTAPITVSGTTISLATGGVTATHLGDGAAAIAEMAPYQDTFVHSFPLAEIASNAWYFDPGSSLVVPTGAQATCIVSQSTRINHDTAISGTNYMYGYPHYRLSTDVGNGTNIGQLSSSYSTMYFQNGGAASSTSVSGTVVLAAGTWQFGCRIGMTSTTNVTSGTCNVNVLCF
jgi:hypothetical protein